MIPQKAQEKARFFGQGGFKTPKKAFSKGPELVIM